MIFLELFWTFFLIGAFTFGGGYAMIPMITQQVVSKGWVTTEILTDIIAIGESTPGPFAVNIAAFVGIEMGGITGATFATLGVVLPSFIVILIIAKFFGSFSENKYVRSALSGLRPAVVGLIASATYSIITATVYISNPDLSFFSALNWRAILIFAIVFAISRLKEMHPVWLVLMSGALGILFYGFIPG